MCRPELTGGHAGPPLRVDAVNINMVLPIYDGPITVNIIIRGGKATLKREKTCEEKGAGDLSLNILLASYYCLPPVFDNKLALCSEAIIGEKIALKDQSIST
jgi:hypothetical protein